MTNRKPINETNYSKYQQIVEAVLKAVPMATTKDIDAVLFNDWPNMDEHMDWLETASVKESAGWAEGIVTDTIQAES